MSDPLAFSIPQTVPPFTMWDYSKSKFDYHRDKSGGWRFIAVPGNISLNQQKLIPGEQTRKQLPGNPRRTMTLEHKIYKTVFHLMDVGKFTASFHGAHAQWACLHANLLCTGFCFGVSLYKKKQKCEKINSMTPASFHIPQYINKAGLTRTIHSQLTKLREIIVISI